MFVIYVAPSLVNISIIMEAFLSQHSDEFILLETGKVQCVLTKHEMKADLNVVKTYFEGKNYKNAKKRLSGAKLDLAHYPYISEYLICFIMIH